ncbi:MAG TPA: hypothetical protein VFU22_11390 [Roseiflexaceae bacterium]|nr:hypothetical protein [Roseiflexaceae bacterium]
MNTYYLRRGLLVALFGIVLAACGSNSQAGQPTTLPNPQPSPAATASPVPAATGAPAPTAASPATSVPAPTATPAAKPIIGFNPQAGAPGTVVSVFGSGYLPGAPVTVRLGLPQPTGEVLTSAFADASGRWTASLTIPDRLPSGEVIGGTPVYLVAMNDQNIALASAPFGFTSVRPAPSRAEATQTVRDLLAAVGKSDIMPFLAWNLRDQLNAGRPLDQVLGLHPIALNWADVRGPEDRPADVLFVPATLSYQGFSEERMFLLVVEDGRWKVTDSQLVQNPVPAQPADAIDAVRLFLTSTQIDRSMDAPGQLLPGQRPARAGAERADPRRWRHPGRAKSVLLVPGRPRGFDRCREQLCPGHAILRQRRRPSKAPVYGLAARGAHLADL